MFGMILLHHDAQRVLVNSAASEFGTCCDQHCNYSWEMQNMLYSEETPNSPGAELTRILSKLLQEGEQNSGFKLNISPLAKYRYMY
jgi:hypothetical protein